MENDRNVFALIFHDQGSHRWLVNTDGQAFRIHAHNGLIDNVPCYERTLQGVWIPTEFCIEKPRVHEWRTRAIEKQFQKLLRAWEPYLNN